MVLLCYFFIRNSLMGSTNMLGFVPHATEALSYGRGLCQLTSCAGLAHVRASLVVVRGSNQVTLPVGPRITRLSLVTDRGLLNLRSDMIMLQQLLTRFLDDSEGKERRGRRKTRCMPKLVRYVITWHTNRGTCPNQGWLSWD
jgi:hypothetical protein